MKLHMYFAAFLASSLVACGGGSGSNLTNTQTSSSSTPTSTVIAQGMVSGFGSVIVNGIHYDVKDAQINIDSESQVESDLEVGHLVHVVGTVSTDGVHAKATKIEAESQLIGTIDSIDLTTSIISALGQTIIFNGDTFFKDGLTADMLKVGDIIQVSGFVNAQGQLLATHIKTRATLPANEMQLTGVVADLDTTAKTFTINGKLVNYAAAILTELPDGALANGQRMRLHGTIANEVFTVAGAIRLSTLDIHSDHEVTASLELEVEGVVSDLVAGISFKLGDLTVLVDSNTAYKEGVADNLINGAHVKIHGKLNADRNLVAATIKFHVQPQVDESGTVQSIDIVNSTFTLNNIIFEVNTDTSVRDDGKSKVHLFNLNSLVVGDLVHVRGYKVLGDSTTADRFVATIVVREDPTEDKNKELGVELTGLVDALDGKIITILNHQIELNAFTKFEGFANLDAFLAGAVGIKIEVTAVMDGGRLLARKISLVVIETHHSESAHSESSRSEANHSESNHSESHSSTASENHSSNMSEIHSSEVSTSSASESSASSQI